MCLIRNFMLAYNSRFPSHTPTATLHQHTTPPALGTQREWAPSFLWLRLIPGRWAIGVTSRCQEVCRKHGERISKQPQFSASDSMLCPALLTIFSLNGLVGSVRVEAFYVLGSPWGGCLLAFNPVWYPLCRSEGWSFQFLVTSTWQA